MGLDCRVPLSLPVRNNFCFYCYQSVRVEKALPEVTWTVTALEKVDAGLQVYLPESLGSAWEMIKDVTVLPPGLLSMTMVPPRLRS